MTEDRQQNPESPGNKLSQGEIVELLRQTIQQLDRVVTRLDRGAIAQLPSQTTLDNLVASTKALSASLTVEKSEIETKTTEKLVPPPVTQTKPSNQIPVAKKLEPSVIQTETSEPVSSAFGWFDRVLKAIRALLPTALEEKLSDWALTGILTGIIVVLLSSSVLLLPKSATEIAENLPKTAPEAPETVATPPQLIAPGKPKPVEIEPPAAPELTPEQSLIASIQEQVAALTSQYPEGVILSIEASFLDSRLMVMLGEQWYQLNQKKQQKLANAILERSRRLDFRKLQLLDANGTLLARNPVVGNDMVILHPNL